MTTHLVTFSDSSMSRSAELCIESAKRNGVKIAHKYNRADIDGWARKHDVDLDARGVGFWAWKPAIILETMNRLGFIDATFSLPGNNYIVYADAGIELINNVNYIIDRMDQDIFLFGNMYEHAHWCKRDIVEAVWPGRKCLPITDIVRTEEEMRDHNLRSAWELFGKQVQASVIFFRVNDHTRAFVKEWLDWCLSGVRIGAAISFGKDNPQHRDERMTWSEFRYLIDDSPSVFPNHPEFRENRHDQAILTTMAYRNGIRLHYWPARYNDGAFTYERGDYPDEGYPILFHHHRRRNHGWEAVA